MLLNMQKKTYLLTFLKVMLITLVQSGQEKNILKLDGLLVVTYVHVLKTALEL